MFGVSWTINGVTQKRHFMHQAAMHKFIGWLRVQSSVSNIIVLESFVSKQDRKVA